MSNKAREALEVIAEICDGKDIGGLDRIVGIYNIAKAALAEPLRNCDVGTAEEQGKRLLAQFDQWKRKNEGKQVIVALMEWAQSPYEEVRNEQ
jgi:hypothetical protein